jgi:hypothetical protein
VEKGLRGIQRAKETKKRREEDEGEGRAAGASEQQLHM